MSYASAVDCSWLYATTNTNSNVDLSHCMIRALLAQPYKWTVVLACRSSLSLNCLPVVVFRCDGKVDFISAVTQMVMVLFALCQTSASENKCSFGVTRNLTGSARPKKSYVVL
jgi:hypothetical protein